MKRTVITAALLLMVFVIPAAGLCDDCCDTYMMKRAENYTVAGGSFRVDIDADYANIKVVKSGTATYLPARFPARLSCTSM